MTEGARANLRGPELGAVGTRPASEAEGRRAGAGPGRRLLGLLFDKDGTLFDFHRTWSAWSSRLIRDLAAGDARREAALADALGFDLDAGRFHPASPVVAGTLQVVVAAVLRAVPEAEPAAFLARLKDAAAAVRPVEAAPLAPLLDRLRADGLTLGVATNDAEGVARAQLARLGILDRFDFVAGYDSGFGAKPDAGMPAAFCAASGIAPAEAAMIGDSVHDLLAGRAAGMAAVAVLTGPVGRERLAPLADAVLPSVAALPDWLAGRG
jgi:phosphoglycolate phosphatase